MKKRLSISDIANNLGISVTTVSFILNDKAKEKRISDAMIKRVLDYVQKVGYKPNQLAKSLRTGKSRTLGLLVEDISNPFFAHVADRIEKLAYEHGYHIIYCSMNNDELRAKELIQLFYDRQVDGFIIAPTEGLQDIIQRLIKNNVPVVLFDRNLKDVKCNTVLSENKEGAYIGTKFLIEEKSAQRVGFITTNSTQMQMKGRLEGYMQAVDEVGMDMLVKKINTSFGEDEVIQQIKNFLSINQLDAVLFATNYLAVSGIKAIKSNILDVPNLISFDDNILFSLIEPPISAIAQDIEAIAQQVIRLLLLNINGKSERIEKVIVPCQLIPR